MSTSKSDPQGGAPSAYARFIPREELGSFSAWAPPTIEPAAAPAKPDGGVRKPTLAERAAAEVRSPMKASPAHHAPQATGSPIGAAARPVPAAAGGAQAASSPAVGGAQTSAARRPIVGGMPGQAQAQAQAEAAPAAVAPAPQVEELVNQARQVGYQDGYRNGLAALESYKQTQAAQMAAYMSDQVGALASDFHRRLESLEQQLAGRIAGVALELARQVVRTELTQNPEVVVDVAEQALGALLASARQIVLRLNPEDHALAQAHLVDLLQIKGARLVADPAITRGGCLVESDIAVIDATVEARWERAAASLGHTAPWNGGREAQIDTAAQGQQTPSQDDWAHEDSPSEVTP